MIRGLQDITKKQLRGLRRRRNRNVGCVWEFRASQQGWAVICGYKESTARLSRNQRQSAQIGSAARTILSILLSPFSEY